MIIGALQNTRGAMLVILDIRNITKEICCLPRFPFDPLPYRISNLKVNCQLTKVIERCKRLTKQMYDNIDKENNYNIHKEKVIENEKKIENKNEIKIEKEIVIENEKEINNELELNNFIKHDGMVDIKSIINAIKEDGKGFLNDDEIQFICMSLITCGTGI